MQQIPLNVVTSAPASGASPPGAVLRAVTWLSAILRKWMVGALLAVLALSLLFHHQAAALKSIQFFRIPGTGSYFDFPTLALTILMFTASVQCKFEDFKHLLDSPRAAIAGLLLHYLAAPLVAIVFSTLAVGVFEGEAAREIRLGLIFISIMPVALTAAVWVRTNRGNVPLLLTLVVITTAAAVITVPLYVRLIPGMGDSQVVIPFAEMAKQLVFSITLPLLAGMLLQSSWPTFVTRWQPAFSLVGMCALFASSGTNVGAAAPKIAAHSSLLAAAAMVTLLLSAMGYGLGLLIARRMLLGREDALCLTFGSGMKNPAAAMVISSASFPTMPLVPVPAALASIAQHVIAGFLTKAIADSETRILGAKVGANQTALEQHLQDAFEATGRQPALALLVFELPAYAANGNKLLSVLGRVRGTVRADDFVCKLGPGAFGIVLSHATPVGIARVVDKVICTLASRDVEGWSAMRFGVAESNAHRPHGSRASLAGLDAQSFIRAAFDDAVVRAGGNPRLSRASISDSQQKRNEEESCTRSPSYLEMESALK